MRKKRRTLAKRTYIKKQRFDEPKVGNMISRLSPETKKGIFVVFLLIFGFISFLGLFDLVGALGKYLTIGTSVIFGWLHFITPIVFIILGYMYLFPSKYNIGLRHYLGLLLFVLSSSGILNLFIDSNSVKEELLSGRGGGYIGMIFYWPLYELSGMWGSLIILFGLFVVSILIMFDLSISELNFINTLRKKMKIRRERAQYEEEYEEIIDDDPDSADSLVQESLFDKKQGKNIGDKDSNISEKFSAVPQEQEKKRKVYRDIKIPMELLSDKKSTPASCDIEAGKEKIRKTLANFGINVEMSDVNVGPTVTQFTLKPDESVRLAKIGALQDNLALSLAAHPLRIEAPIPGKSLVGIEVPNRIVSIVRLREILSDNVFKQSDGHLVFALGKDVTGKNIAVNLDKMPHLLIAGATGSGKSVMVNCLILSLLYRLNPNELKFIFVDPKRVELSPYNGIPHLLTPVITKADKTVNALKWSVAEMERRYELLERAGRKDISSYNQSVSKVEDRMPSIVIVIDELAEVMLVNPVEAETSIIRLAQMARAVGIHLVLATQRPSVNVITGLIKANITSRIAFSVASQIDSRTVLDTGGAEKLLGKGDMLFISAELSKPRRLQGAFISEEEKDAVIDFLKKQASPEYLPEITDPHEGAVAGLNGKIENWDPLVDQAKQIVVNYDKASATLFQRKLSVGYARAAKILDQLESLGYVGPANGPKPRDVLITQEDIEDQEIAKLGSQGTFMEHAEAQAEEEENAIGLDDEDFPVEANTILANELVSDALKKVNDIDVGDSFVGEEDDDEIEFEEEEK